LTGERNTLQNAQNFHDSNLQPVKIKRRWFDLLGL